METKKVNELLIIKKLYRYRHSYVLMLPFFLVFFLFTIWPVILSVGLSFTNYSVFQKPEYIGWQNYVNLFVNDDIFSIAVKNTLVFALFTGPLGYLLSLLFAWIINELPKGIREIMTLVLYAPSIAGAGMFTIWLIIFDPDIYGYLNSFLLQMGIIDEPVQWLTNPQYMMTVVVIVQLWVSMGTSFLTMRAGFSTVDKQYYEAGLMDGIRNRWQELWYITLPAMGPHLVLSAILAITASFGAEAVATAMTGFPSTGYATHTIMHHMRDYGFIRFQRGYACAIAVILFLISICLNKIIQHFIRKVGT